MIRIFKDNDVKIVTQGVYNNLYKPLGYKPIIEEKPKKTIVDENKEIKKTEQVKGSSKDKRNRGE